MSDELAGQVAMVTGSGRGFGREIALGLAQAGASVAVTSRTKSEIDETVALIEAAGGKAVGVAGDVTNLADMLNVRKVAEERLGPVDIAIHNAGVPWPFGPTWYVDPARWWAAQGVHVLGGMHVVNTYVPGMIDRHRGHVIFVSSIGGVRVAPNMSGYCVAKATQIRLVEFIGAEAAEHGVFAFAIHPGDELTEISEITRTDPDAQKYASGFVERLNSRAASGTEDPSVGFQKCRTLCVNLSSGKYDGLTGRYLEPDDDLDALLKQPGVEATDLV